MVLAVIFTFDFPLKGGSHLPRIFSTFKAPPKGGALSDFVEPKTSPLPKGGEARKFLGQPKLVSLPPFRGGDCSLEKTISKHRFVLFGVYQWKKITATAKLMMKATSSKRRTFANPVRIGIEATPEPPKGGSEFVVTPIPKGIGRPNRRRFWSPSVLFFFFFL
jgi:hypothetical protein